jgi:hypothetical protein
MELDQVPWRDVHGNQIYNSTLTIVDIGAKYSKISTLISKRFSLTFDDVFNFKKLKKDLTPEIKNMIPEMISTSRKMWDETVKNCPVGRLKAEINGVLTHNHNPNPAADAIMLMDIL